MLFPDNPLFWEECFFLSILIGKPEVTVRFLLCNFFNGSMKKRKLDCLISNKKSKTGSKQ